EGGEVVDAGARAVKSVQQILAVVGVGGGARAAVALAVCAQAGGVGDRFRQQVAVGVVGVDGGPAGFGDLGRQVEFRVPLGGDGSRLRRAVGFGARGLQSAAVALVGGDVAVGVGVLGQKTGG